VWDPTFNLSFINLVEIVVQHLSFSAELVAVLRRAETCYSTCRAWLSRLSANCRSARASRTPNSKTSTLFCSQLCPFWTWMAPPPRNGRGEGRGAPHFVFDNHSSATSNSLPRRRVCMFSLSRPSTAITSLQRHFAHFLSTPPLLGLALLATIFCLGALGPKAERSRIVMAPR
jgi:hypothetical protein